MVDVKVRLSLSVPGAQLLSSQECEENPKDCYNTVVVSIEHTTKKGKKKRENIVIKTRKQRLAKQSINISREGYDYMVDPKSPPTQKLAKKVVISRVVGKRPDGKPIKVTEESTVWAASYSAKQRLEFHLNKVAEHLGAISYTYEILED